MPIDTKVVSIRTKRQSNHFFEKICSGMQVKTKLDKRKAYIKKVGGLNRGKYLLEKSIRDDVIIITNHLNNRTVFFFLKPVLST